MISISLCMIVKDKEAVIERCLQTIHPLVDEIIVVDTGSADATKNLAGRYTKQVYDFQWIDDFSAARNFSFSLATKEYILWLDADDAITKEDLAAFHGLKQTLDPQIDLVMMKYNAPLDEGGSQVLAYDRERLLKRSLNYRWIGPIHEMIIPKGNVLYSSIAISRGKPADTDPLWLYEGAAVRGGRLGARERCDYANRLIERGRYQKAAAVLCDLLGGEIIRPADDAAARRLLLDCRERIKGVPAGRQISARAAT